MSFIIKYGKKTFNDMYSLYPKDVNEKRRLAHLSEPSFCFRAKDGKDYFEEVVQRLGISVDVRQALTIITPTNGVITANDKVVNVKDKSVWIVLGATTSDDNTNKEFSAIPPKHTIVVMQKWNG